MREGCTEREAVDWLLWDVNRQVALASTRFLLVHAAGVERAGRAVMLPGASGAGKTTLAAGLVVAGFGYLTDELVALSADGASIAPFPKSLALDAGSLAALRGLPEARAVPGAGAASGTVYIAADVLRPGAPSPGCEPAVIAFPRYRPDASASALHLLSDADALLELLTHTVNLGDHGGGGMQALADLVERCWCVRIDVADLAGAIRLVEDVFEGRA